jgi:predicted CXXCH cytochrome family protein
MRKSISKTKKEVNTMKKTLLIVCLMLFSVVLIYGTAGAVSGNCANCHTMHNSQDGASVAKDDDGNTTATPNARLLKAGCVSCHSGPVGTHRDGDFGPIVLHTGAPADQGVGATNAGGDFYWVDLGSDTKGHNVDLLPTSLGSNEDAQFYEPPGFDSSMGVVGGTWNSTNQLTCAGEYGCHGDHTTGYDSWDGVKGAHHSNNTGIINAATTANAGDSYRFLNGISGVEDPDWQWTVTSSAHNEYKGVNDAAGRAYDSANDYTEAAAAGTISYLCAECHGDFHADVANDADYSGPADPWRRHPTDIALPTYAGAEYSAYTTYSVEAPVGRVGTLVASNSTVTPGTDVVICLSCHRAHGSNEPDLLRWTYTDMVAGTSNTTGCFTCHTTKDEN